MKQQPLSSLLVGVIASAFSSKTDDVPREKLALRRAVESLSQKVASTKEYTVISETKDNPYRPITQP
jgi:hypothetical protein